MTYSRLVGQSLDYAPCQYGRSKLSFRGPKSEVEEGHLAFVGSTETYGKFVENPFPSLVGDALGVPVLNLGCVNAGIDSFLEDDSVIDLCRSARSVVIQAMGAHKMSNRLYRVHPRRNDRFLAAAPALQDLYPEVDWSEIHFTRHLMTVLATVGPRRFETVLAELREAWVQRMRLLLRRIERPVTLLWISDRSPDQGGGDPTDGEPLFVTAGMIDALRPALAGICEMPARARREEAQPGMVCGETDLPAARQLPGPEDHAEIATRLAATLADQAVTASRSGREWP